MLVGMVTLGCYLVAIAMVRYAAKRAAHHNAWGDVYGRLALMCHDATLGSDPAMDRNTAWALALSKHFPPGERPKMQTRRESKEQAAAIHALQDQRDELLARWERALDTGDGGGYL